MSEAAPESAEEPQAPAPAPAPAPVPAPAPSKKQMELTEAQILEFKEMFDLMDRDKGGTLGADEIKQLMEMLGMKMRPDELDALIAEIDSDGSGQIEFEEFLQMFARPDDPPGFIHPDALEQALVKYAGDKVTPEEAVRLAHTLELDARGFVDYESKVKVFVSK